MISLNKKLKGISMLALCGIMLCGAGSPVYAATAPSITYSTHVENVGWQEYVKMGEMSGTSGRSLRLEGIQIKLDKGDYDIGIEYQTHIQNIGWEAEIGDTWNGNPVPGWKTSDVVAGTYGRAWRLEGIKIRLTGADADKFDVLYKTHIQNIGWEKEWKKNGEMSGTSGQSLRLEGIHIKIVAKDQLPVDPGPTTPPDQTKDPRDLNGDGTVTQEELDQWYAAKDGDQSWDKNSNGILDPDEVDDWKSTPPQETPIDTRPDVGDIEYAPTYTPWEVHTTCSNHAWMQHSGVYPVNGVPVFELHHTYWDGSKLHDMEQEYKADVAKGCKYNFVEWLYGHGNTLYPNGIHVAFPELISPREFLLRASISVWADETILGHAITPDERQWVYRNSYIDFYYCMNCGETTLIQPDGYK